MAEVNPTLVKQLRDKTNAGMMDCKRALVESDGDLSKAEDILRKKGIASASKKATRTTKEGVIASYIHLQGKVGVLVEINCETDFVAKNDNFRDFVKDITLHIAAAHPLYVGREQVPAPLVEREREIYRAQVTGKPANIVEKIAEGKMKTWFAENVLVEQPFVKDDSKTVGDLLKSAGLKLVKFIRFKRSRARWPLPCVASQRGDSGSEKRKTKMISAAMPMTTQIPRQPIMSRKPSANNVPSGQGNAPPISCIAASERPRMRFGAYSAV